MANSKIKPEDIEVLTRLLFLPKELIIYDPEKRISSGVIPVVRDVTALLKSAAGYKACVNLSSQQLEVLPFEFILEFDQPKRSYKSFFKTPFLTIKNRDGSLRWCQPEAAKHPNFLALYNGSGFKAAAFNLLAGVFFQLGLKKWFCSNSFYLYSKKEQHLRQHFDDPEMALFTGTIGENRKGVAALCQNGKATHFIKIPVSKKAEKLIEAEYQHLAAVNQFDLKKLSVPVAHRIANGLKLTNIKPEESSPTIRINKIHLDALKDIYANTFQLKILADTSCYKKVEVQLSSIKQAKKENSGKISPKKIERLSYNLKVLLNHFETNQLIPVAYAHGDFTPWNMFLSEHKVHLYDWELAMPEQVLLYDAFHFAFQSSTLLLHQSFDTIKMKIKELRKLPLVEDLIDRYRLDFWDCYRWYLIHNCSYYLDLYIRQETLHKQAHWLIDCWIAATNDAITKPKQEMVFIA